ncbi:MAG: hypothetical protein DYH20_09345 [Gammaproteobacteria bacterium PRO9]|nr:hypothetical protein [Gammaproteobacteria bacterium PRO9]
MTRLYLARLPDGADQARVYELDARFSSAGAWRFDKQYDSAGGGRRYRGVAAIDTTAESASRRAWAQRTIERERQRQQRRIP